MATSIMLGKMILFKSGLWNSANVQVFAMKKRTNNNDKRKETPQSSEQPEIPIKNGSSQQTQDSGSESFFDEVKKMFSQFTNNNVFLFCDVWYDFDDKELALIAMQSTFETRKRTMPSDMHEIVECFLCFTKKEDKARYYKFLNETVKNEFDRRYGTQKTITRFSCYVYGKIYYARKDDAF
jgi:hypothetical protein